MGGLRYRTLGSTYGAFGEPFFSGSLRSLPRASFAWPRGGADLILIETMSDVYELKAAILAAKENSNLPIICTMTFQEDGRT